MFPTYTYLRDNNFEIDDVVRHCSWSHSEWLLLLLLSTLLLYLLILMLMSLENVDRVKRFFLLCIELSCITAQYVFLYVVQMCACVMYVLQGYDDTSTTKEWKEYKLLFYISSGFRSLQIRFVYEIYCIWKFTYKIKFTNFYFSLSIHFFCHIFLCWSLFVLLFIFPYIWYVDLMMHDQNLFDIFIHILTKLSCRSLWIQDPFWLYKLKNHVSYR